MPIASSLAIVLAAGRGRRMGGPKALLPVLGKPLLVEVAEAWLGAGVEEVAAVVNEEVLAALAEEAVRWRWIGPVTADAPMMESVRRGLEEALASKRRWIFLQPVDTGPPSPRVVQRLHRALQENPEGRALVARPVEGGRGGHPLLLDGSALDRIPWRDATSLRSALASLSSGQVLRVEVGDPSILRNWNRPEDLPDAS